MAEKKIGLVIQGALTSVGRSGSKLHESVDEVKKQGLVEFDCRENIRKIIGNYGHLFDEIVVSVFDNQLKPEDGWEGAKIVSGPDPGGVKQEGHYKDNNKVRQFLSTLNGLVELEKSGVEYAIKTRTDTYLDFDLLVKDFFAKFEQVGDPKAIFATVLNKGNFLLHDLYFAARTDAMREFSEAVLSHGEFEFIPSVHRDMVLKHAYKHYKEEIGVPDWAYFPFFPPDGISAETRKIFDYMFEKVFFPLDPAIHRSTLWRGEYFEEGHVDELLEEKPGRKVNPPAFATIDWRRYFHFRQAVSGQSISVLDKSKAAAGKLGWILWNRARKIGRILVR